MLPYLGAAIGVGGLVSLLNGVAEEFTVDLDDLHAIVAEKYAKAAEPELSAEYLKMLDSIGNIDQAIRSRSNATSVDHVNKIITTIESELISLTAAEKNLHAMETGYIRLLPDELRWMLDRTKEAVANLNESWSDFKYTLTYKKTEIEREKQIERSKSVNTETPKTNETSVVPGDTKSSGPIQPQVNAPSDSERIKGIQTFLNRMPYEITGLNHDLEVNGKLDEDTIFVLDNFAEHIANDLGLGNLTGVRLQREADSEKLRQIWDVYKNPWRYQD